MQALYMPATRHFWWWLGVRPIDKANIHKLLAANNSIVLVPGGNTECRLMKHGQETMYLRKRLGFVRLAMNHGAPLVPAFAFGQSDTYSYAPQKAMSMMHRCLTACRAEGTFGAKQTVLLSVHACTLSADTLKYAIKMAHLASLLA